MAAGIAVQGIRAMAGGMAAMADTQENELEQKVSWHWLAAI